MAGRPLAPNPVGAHFLRDRRLITQLTRGSGARTGGLVFDLGAGGGAITAGLAATGARVIAVERDPKLAARLRRRFGDEPNVRVVEADLRTIPLPRRDFLVVASPPFSVTTALCRRLLGDPAVPLAGAELIVQWGAARWLTAKRPRDAETAWWSARYQIRIARVINSASFAPPPRVHTAWLSVRPRAVPVSARGQRCLRSTLESAYRRPGTRAEIAVTCGRRLLLRAGLDPVAAEVQDDSIRRPAGGHCQRFPRAACSHDVVQPGPQVDQQLPLQPRVVLDDQNPRHVITIRTSPAVA